MANATSKRSEAPATVSAARAFRRATWGLAAWYAAAALALLLAESAFAYGVFVSRLDFGGVTISLDGAPGVSGGHGFRAILADERETISEVVREQLLRSLLVVDVVLTLVALFGSYLLARRTLRPIEEAYERQRRFVADAAHELRTPLAVIRAAAEVSLASQGSREDLRAALADIVDEVDGMAATSGDLLAIARAGAAPERALQEVNLAALAADRAAAFAPYAAKRGATIAVEASSEISARGDAADLNRLLGNLIRNAVDHGREGGKVSVRVSGTDDGALLAVEDDGPGVPEEALPRVFEPFFKAAESRGGGSGLGLAIVQVISARHGAKVSIESHVGKGTTVRVNFPKA